MSDNSSIAAKTLAEQAREMAEQAAILAEKAVAMAFAKATRSPFKIFSIYFIFYELIQAIA